MCRFPSLLDAWSTFLLFCIALLCNYFTVNALNFDFWVLCLSLTCLPAVKKNPLSPLCSITIKRDLVEKINVECSGTKVLTYTKDWDLQLYYKIDCQLNASWITGSYWQSALIPSFNDRIYLMIHVYTKMNPIDSVSQSTVLLKLHRGFHDSIYYSFQVAVFCYSVVFILACYYLKPWT